MCCGRRPTGSRGQTGTDVTEAVGGASTGAAAGTYTVTTPGGDTVTKNSEIAAKLYVASHPGASYTKN